MAVDMTHGLQFFDPGSDGVNGSQAAAGTRDTLLQQSGRLHRDERDRGGNAWRVVHFSLVRGIVLLLWRCVTLHERALHGHAFLAVSKLLQQTWSFSKIGAFFVQKTSTGSNKYLKKLHTRQEKKTSTGSNKDLKKLHTRQEKKTRTGSNNHLKKLHTRQEKKHTPVRIRT
jgi:hypothetical protein